MQCISHRHVTETTNGVLSSFFNFQLTSQPRQAKFSGCARFPLSWRWRHAAAPGGTAQPRTEGGDGELKPQPQLLRHSARLPTEPGGPGPFNCKPRAHRKLPLLSPAAALCETTHTAATKCVRLCTCRPGSAGTRLEPRWDKQTDPCWHVVYLLTVVGFM